LAKEDGMITMREDGYLKAIAGLTSIGEVNRVATMEDSTDKDDEKDSKDSKKDDETVKKEVETDAGTTKN
jgi:hypothetical protein